MVITATMWIVSMLPIAATVLPFVKSGRSWIRVWDYPRLQLAIALALCFAIQIVLLTGTAAAWLLAATAASLIWQLWRIHPYTRLAGLQVRSASHHDPAQTVGILIANVLQTNRDPAALLERVAAADPDVVLAVETDTWWDAQLSALSGQYPFVVRNPLDNTYGMLLFSRLALSGVKVQFRVNPGVPSIAVRLHLRSGEMVDLHCLHPEPPRVGRDVDERDAELLIVGREAAASTRAVIVCGDLNDVAWSHSTRLFQRVSGLLDPRVGRGLYSTFHAGYWFARWPLDHVFHDAAFTLRHLQVLDAIGSDHFPIYVQLVHDPPAARRHDVPAADEDDQRQARERIAEGVGSDDPPPQPSFLLTPPAIGGTQAP
jgi:endonuclease/exonuclease/phosphatase (EEP) superfamily protein YafD